MDARILRVLTRVWIGRVGFGAYPSLRICFKDAGAYSMYLSLYVNRGVGLPVPS